MAKVKRQQSEYIKQKIEQNKAREEELLQVKDQLMDILVMPALARNWYKTRIDIKYGFYMPIMEIKANNFGIFNVYFNHNGTIDLVPRRKYLKEKFYGLPKYFKLSDKYRCESLEEMYEIVKNMFLDKKKIIC